MQTLFGGAGFVTAWPQPRRPWHPRKRHCNEVLYRGPFRIPAHIAAVCAETPDMRSRTGSLNPKKLIMCYDERNRAADPALLKWRFRCPIPAHRCMVGEIQRGSDGIYRIVSYAAADSVRREAQDILAWKLKTPGEREALHAATHPTCAAPARTGGIIMPPLMPPLPPKWATAEEFLAAATEGNLTC